MSNWYSVMLIVSYKDEDKIEQINEWVKEQCGYRYNETYEKFELMGYFNHAYYAYINYLPLEKFIDHLKTIDWWSAYNTQVFVSDQTGMDRYELINIEN